MILRGFLLVCLGGSAFLYGALPAPALDINKWIETHPRTLESQRVLGNVRAQYESLVATQSRWTYGLGVAQESNSTTVSSGTLEVSSKSDGTVGSAKMRKEFLSGTALTLEGQKKLDGDETDAAYTDQQWSLGVSQDLVGNSFGKTQKADRAQAKAALEVAQISLEETKDALCQEMYQGISQWWAHDVRLRIRKQSLKLGQESFALSKKLRNKRLIGDDDFYLARVNLSSVRQQVLQSEVQLSQSKTTVESWAGRPMVGVKPPKRSVSGAWQKVIYSEKDQKELTRLQWRLQEVAAKKTRLKSQNSGQLALNASVGESKGVSFSSGSFFNSDSQQVSVGLQWTGDFSKTPQSQGLIEALREEKLLQSTEVSLKRTLRQKWNSLKQNLQLNLQKIESQKEQVRLLKLREKIMKEEYSTGRIEFTDYLTAIERHLTAEIGLVDTEAAAMVNFVQFMVQSGQRSQVCL